MIGIADIAACKELYERSGWKGQYWWWTFKVQEDGSAGYVLVGEHEAPFHTSTIPAYDVNYLLYKMPGMALQKHGDGGYTAKWTDYIHRSSRTNAANALCRLAVALIAAGILFPENE